MRNSFLSKVRSLMPAWNHVGSTINYPTMPSQSMGEWQAYLEFIETYFRNRGIKKPLIVEIGIGRGRQKLFYEDILGYDHIGIDHKRPRKPDIRGNSRDPATLNKLKNKLNGREVNLLYIDGRHTYSGVKADYKLYSPLAKNIIVIHDIVFKDHEDTVGEFWEELICQAKKRKIQDRTFIVLIGFYTKRDKKVKSFGPGVGLILLEEMSS